MVCHSKAFKLTITFFHYFTNSTNFTYMGLTQLVHQYFTYFFFDFVASQVSNTHIIISFVILYIYLTFQLHLWSQIPLRQCILVNVGYIPPRSGFSVFSSAFCSFILSLCAFITNLEFPSGFSPNVYHCKSMMSLIT